jgi:hypothetical protein
VAEDPEVDSSHSETVFGIPILIDQKLADRRSADKHGAGVQYWSRKVTQILISSYGNFFKCIEICVYAALIVLYKIPNVFLSRTEAAPLFFRLCFR